MEGAMAGEAVFFFKKKKKKKKKNFEFI